jgi:hypothetical protein
MAHRRRAPGHLRIELAHALGFPEYPAIATAEPYLNYIANRHVGRGSLEEYLKLFIYIVGYFMSEDDGEDPASAKSIQGLLDIMAASSSEYFLDTTIGSQTRRDDVEDTALYIIGIWTLLLSSFVHLPIAGGARKIALAYSIRAQETPSASKSYPYEENIAGLISGSGLLPVVGQWGLPESSNGETANLKAAIPMMDLLKLHKGSIPSLGSPTGSLHSLHQLGFSHVSDARMSLRFLDDLDSFESMHVAAIRLNAYTLSVFGAVDIAWTHNISRHMLLCKRGGRHVLEVFALPCALSAATLTSSAVGITPEYAQEVTESYSILFNAWSDTPRHAKVGKFIGSTRFCWCWSCSARRYRTCIVSRYRKLSRKQTPASKRSRSAHASEFDPLLVDLMHSEPSDWTPELFPSLWSRIMVLEEHLQAAKPWNIWILFRDRRDTLQFWTFL